MHATIQHLGSLIRVGPDCCRYGDPYRKSVVVNWIDPETVELMGVDQPWTVEETRAMRQLLRGLGVRELRVKTIHGGRSHVKVIKLDRR